MTVTDTTIDRAEVAPPDKPPAAILAWKLAQVVKQVSGVEKDGVNAFHKYSYTSAEAMLRAIRGPLAEAGVTLLPTLDRVEEREVKTAKGGASTITTAYVQFEFVDHDTGNSYISKWAGQGDDPADKGLGKAYTNAIKTFLREAFLIPQGDDPEADTQTDKRSADRVSSEPVPPKDPVDRRKGFARYAFAAVVNKSPEDARPDKAEFYELLDGASTVEEVDALLGQLSAQLVSLGGDPSAVKAQFDKRDSK